MSKEALKRQLEVLQIDYQEYLHPPLHTCTDADFLKIERPGTRLKNLFLRDNYGRRHFLLITEHDKNVDLKALTKQLGVSRLGFASEARLEKYLDVKPGCVSMLALVNDQNKDVELLVDQSIWNSALLHCHPLINTATWILTKSDIMKFLERTGHKAIEIRVPSRKTE